MKQWYVFYTGDPESQQLLSTFGDTIKVSAEKLNQVGSEIRLSTRKKSEQVKNINQLPSSSSPAYEQVQGAKQLLQRKRN